MKKWKGMVGVLACAFLYSSMYLLPYIKYIFYDAIVAATGFTNTQIGITLSVYIVAAIISTVPSGWIADRFPPKKMLVLSGVAHAIFSAMALLFIRSYTMTLVCFFLMGLSSTLGFWSPVSRPFPWPVPRKIRASITACLRASTASAVCSSTLVPCGCSPV